MGTDSDQICNRSEKVKIASKSDQIQFFLHCSFYIWISENDFIA